MKTEDDPKMWQTGCGEAPNSINMKPIQSKIDEIYRKIKYLGMTGGLVRQPVLNGVGRSTFEWVFAGNVREPQGSGEWSDTCDATADPKLSLGSNNIAVEATLRKHKLKLEYKEPERRGGIRHRRGRF